MLIFCKNISDYPMHTLFYLHADIEPYTRGDGGYLEISYRLTKTK